MRSSQGPGKFDKEVRPVERMHDLSTNVTVDKFERAHVLFFIGPSVEEEGENSQ